MEVGLYFKWGKPVPGHEREALELFAEALDYWNKKREAGIVTWFEPFGFQTADFEQEAGFWVVKGPEEKIMPLWKDEKFIYLTMKAGIFLEHFFVGTLRVGDEYTKFIDQLGKVYAEVGV